MKKVISLFMGPIVAFAVFLAPVFAGTTSVSWEAPVHNQGLNFQASYQNGVVSMTWNKFVPTASSWQYYKVVRSTSIQNPYYPDHGYIKALGDQNTTSFVDSNPPAGTVYYGVCAITQSSWARHRNCDWQAVTVDGSATYNGDVATDTTTTTTTVTSSPELSDAMKAAVDGLVEKFKLRLGEKFGNDTAGKKAFLTALVPVIDNVIATSSDANKPMFQYLRTKIVEYQGIVELESLLNVE